MADGCPICKSDDASPVLAVLARRMVRCRHCGLIYRVPRPAGRTVPPSSPTSPEEVAAEERVGARRTRHFEAFVRRAGRPARILDVGCGYGFFLRVAQAGGWEAVGVDLDRHAVAYARDRLGVDARWGELKDLDLPAGGFDVVTLWNVLECVADPLGVLEEVHRLAKPGGAVFVRTQNAAWHVGSFRATRLLGRLGLGAALGERPYVAFIFNRVSFSRATLRRVLEHAGFTGPRIRNSRPIAGDPYLGVSPWTERLFTAGKLAVHGGAEALALASGGRWLVGPSIEAWARRSPEPAP